MSGGGSHSGSMMRSRATYAVALALLVGALVAPRIFCSTVRTPRSHVVSTTACYVALSNDLAPLIGSRGSNAAASAECAAQLDRPANMSGADRMRS